jgi:hypothetical protein
MATVANHLFSFDFYQKQRMINPAQSVIQGHDCIISRDRTRVIPYPPSLSIRWILVDLNHLLFRHIENNPRPFPPSVKGLTLQAEAVPINKNALVSWSARVMNASSIQEN